VLSRAVLGGGFLLLIFSDSDKVLPFFLLPFFNTCLQRVGGLGIRGL